MKTLKRLAALTGVSMACAMGSMVVFAEDAAASADAGVSSGAMWSSLLLPILLLVFLYFIMIRPQQKADKAMREMQKNLQVGDEVITIGGIVGIVMRVEDSTKTVVLETGSDRLKIRMMQDAIKENVTAREIAEAAKKEKANKKITPSAKSDE